MRIVVFTFFFLSFCSMQAQHILRLKNGETHTGMLKSYQDGTALFEIDGRAMKFSESEIVSIEFTVRLPASEPTGIKGVTYQLQGRNLVKMPVFENLTYKKGIVVVAITVDKYGSVIKATAGAEGSTTSDKYLLDLSRNAALGARFDNCPKCPLQMEGTLTFTY
jgi:hypothetical protein